MQSTETIFQAGWYGSNLEGYRACDSTYCRFSYDSLPPLASDQFQGNFNWLVPLEPHIAANMERFWPEDEERMELATNLQLLIEEAQQRGILLPEPFVKFMSNAELQNRVPSCTACFFNLCAQLMPCPVDNSNFAIQFLVDQQGVVAWYLYLKPSGEHYVIASRSWFDLLTQDDDVSCEDYADAIQGTFFCASSFEEFLYRFWLENRIWFTLVEQHRPLSEVEQRYLQHYLP